MMQVASDRISQAVVFSIAKPRFERYMRRAGHREELALELYAHNLALAGAFMLPLCMLEVTLRNSMDRSLTNHHGDYWFDRKEFKKLHSKRAREAIDETRDQPSGDGKTKSDRVKGVAITNYTLGNWKTMLTLDYREVWASELGDAFPGLDRSPERDIGETMNDLSAELGKIRDFRNRIAHHEPILHLDTRQRHLDILRFLGWLSPEASEWTGKFSQVNKVIDRMPKRRE